MHFFKTYALIATSTDAYDPKSHRNVGGYGQLYFFVSIYTQPCACFPVCQGVAALAAADCSRWGLDATVSIPTC